MTDFPLFKHEHALRAYTFTRFSPRTVITTKMIAGEAHEVTKNVVEEFTVLVVEHAANRDPTKGPSGGYKDSLYTACSEALKELDDEIDFVELRPAR